MNNFKSIYKFTAVNYKQNFPKMAMAIKKMEKTTITVPIIPEDTDIILDILIWDNKYKEAKSKETTFE